MNFQRIRDLREDSDKTQNEIASILNVNQKTYSRYETGERAIPIEALIKLADYYHTSIDYIVNRTNKKS